jgi:hypothetical protein
MILGSQRAMMTSRAIVASRDLDDVADDPSTVGDSEP